MKTKSTGHTHGRRLSNSRTAAVPGPLSTLLLLVAAATGGCAISDPGSKPVAVDPAPVAVEKAASREQVPGSRLPVGIVQPSGGAGPLNWAYPQMNGNTNTWAANYAGCGSTSTQQSPINIVPSNTVSAQTLVMQTGARYQMQLNPKPSSYTYTFPLGAELGALPTFQFGPWGSTGSQGFVIVPNSFHLHTPAEHTISGAAAPALEMHIVSTSIGFGGGGFNANYTVVFAIQFQVGTPSSALSLANVASAIKAGTGSSQPYTFGLGAFLNLFASNPSYSYVGSLTTPPCTQAVTDPHAGVPVTWFVLAATQYVDQATLNLLTSQINSGNSNARLPLQPVTGSTVIQRVN